MKLAELAVCPEDVFDISYGFPPAEFSQFYRIHLQYGVFPHVRYHLCKAFPRVVAFADRGCIMNAVQDSSFPRVISRQCQFFPFFLVCCEFPEYFLQHFKVFHSGFYVFTGIKKIVAFVTACSPGHHLHKTEGPSS